MQTRPLRIMHVVSSPGAGGAEMFVKDLALTMANANHVVMVVFVSHASDLNKDTQFEADYLKSLSENQVAWAFIGHASKKMPLLGMFRLRTLAKEFAPDVIHNHLSYAVIFSAPLRKPIKVFTYHNFKLREPSLFFKLVDSVMDGVVGISIVCAQNLARVLTSTVTCIPNGVDASRLAPADSATKHDILTIAMLGRLCEQKNYPAVVAAASRLKDLQFQILIAGEGPEEGKIREQIINHGLEGSVFLVGNIIDVASFLKRSHIFASSSAWEGLPIALIEASLCHLPVVVTDVGGCSELINDINNGILVPPGSESLLAQALREMMSSESLRARYSENARAHAHLYSIERSAAEHVALYQRLNKTSL